MNSKQELTIVKPETLAAVAKRVKYAEYRHDWPGDLPFRGVIVDGVHEIIEDEYDKLCYELCPKPSQARIKRIFDESLDLAAVAIRCAQKAADALAKLEDK